MCTKIDEEPVLWLRPRGGESQKVKPQFGLCEGVFAVYPASRNGGKRHHPLPEGLLKGVGVV